MTLTRRKFLATTSALGLTAAAPVHAGEPTVELDWIDLVPEEGGVDLEALRELGVVEHGQMSTTFDQETGGQVTEKYNGQVVRIPGYLVPLEFDGTGVSAALLVPYVGACIHVPPPPPNQLIFVTTAIPYENSDLFEPVWVTGLFGTAATATQLAEVGYVISADRIEPYG